MSLRNQFFEELFQEAPDRSIVFRAVAPKKRPKSYDSETNKIRYPDFHDGVNWYFSAGPREHDGKVRSLSAVWCDIDGTNEFSAEWLKFGYSSAVISTGHGIHVYYFLDQIESVMDVVPLIKLAVYCMDGDPKCVDPTRMMRVPGTQNVKYDPVTPCDFAVGLKQPFKRYKLDQVEEILFSILLARYWEEGQRNNMVLGFASMTARAGWTEAKATRVVRNVCKVVGDDDVNNRLDSVKITFAKSQNGEVTSSKEFAQIISPGTYKKIVEIIGCDIQDGEVKVGDEVVGTSATIQQDTVSYLLAGDCDWNYQEGHLIRWNKKFWAPCEKSTLTSSIFDFMANMVVAKGSVEKPLPAKYALSEGVSKLMQGTLAANPMEPHDSNIIGMKNGVFNLETGEFRGFKKEDRLRRLLPIEYNENAKAPLWIKFLKEAQPEMFEFLQEWVGYCLRPGNYFQRMVWAYGASNTGKSTFLVTMFNMFGPTAVTIASQNVSQYQIAMLADAYIAVCTELSTQRFRTGTFKALVAGDPVMARHPYGRPFSVKFHGKFMFGSNSLPPIDEAEGMWKRLVMLPFNNLPRRLDTTLINKLEQELPGIFNWAYVGSQRVVEYQKNNSWAIPNISAETVAHYMQYASLMNIFIDNELTRGENMECSINDVFTRFLDFSRSMGHPGVEFGAWFIEEFRRRNYKIIDMRLYGLSIKSINSMAWGVKGL